LDVCDVVHRALFDVNPAKGTSEPGVALTPGQESNNPYSRFSSFTPSFMSKGSQASGTTESEDSKQKTQSFNDTEEQKRVTRMLDFVQETDINLIVGEWVLARFTGAEGARWFLCTLELGSTHGFHGQRIATDEIDFKNVIPESGLVHHWEKYMHNKTSELCRIITIRIQGRMAKKYADGVAGSEKKGDDVDKMKAEIDEDSDNEDADSKEKPIDMLFKQGTMLGAGLMDNVTGMLGMRMETMLSDNVLQQVPKGFRAAIVNLNRNEDLLPAMFLSGVKVHMF